MNKNITLFFLILILGTLLRFFYITKIPNGLYSDEAAYGYNTYSILLTGRDEHGTFLPLAFKSFGDYKAPFYFYFLIPFVKIFGLSEFAVRFPSVILGLALITLVYFFVRHIFQKNILALAASFLIAISPMSLQFNRMAHENNLVVLLITAGSFLFILSFNKHKLIYLSFLSYLLSIYTYHDARVIVPVLILSLILIYRKQLRAYKKDLVCSLIGLFIFLIPLFLLFRTDAMLARPKNTVVFSDKGTLFKINNERGEDIMLNFSMPSLFHNKAISYSEVVLNNYLLHFSPDFLFFSGDKVSIYSTINNGILYFIELPFLCLGLYLLFKKRFYKGFIFILLLLISPIPAALTKFVPSASRSLSILPSLSVIPAIGLIYSVKYIKISNLKRIYIIIITLLFIFNISYYMHFYYFNTPIRYAKDWHYGMKEVIMQVQINQDHYSKIWFSKNAWGYIYPLFYLAYPPLAYQSINRMGLPNEYGFSWVDKFDRYVFADFPENMPDLRGTLFIGIPSDFNNLKKPLYAVSYPNGETAFYLADYKSF